MLQFLKFILLGFLYIIASPLIVAVLALFLVFGLIIFILQFLKSIALFFTGRTIFSDYPEDIAAKKILGQIQSKPLGGDVPHGPSHQS